MNRKGVDRAPTGNLSLRDVGRPASRAEAPRKVNPIAAVVAPWKDQRPL